MASNHSIHHLRQRSLERRTQISRLSRTQLIEVSNTDEIDISTLFSDRSLPITFAVSVKRTDTDSSGVIFRFGGLTNITAAWVNGADVGFCFGSSTNDEGLTLIATDVLPVVNSFKDFVFVAHPGQRKGAIYANGLLVAQGSFEGDRTDWADNVNGLLGRYA